MNKRRLVVSLLSAVALAAAMSASPAAEQRPLESIQPQTASLPSLKTVEQDLDAAYRETWSSVNREYAKHDHLPKDWADWQHKFDGTMHNEQDLTVALNKLLEHIGDPDVRLLSHTEVLTKEVREMGGHLGYGVISKFQEVYGPTAVFEVEQNAGGCSGGHCWQGVGQAYQDGLRTGDVLLAVDGKSFKGLEFWDLFGYVIAHDQVTFTVQRGSQILTIVAHPQHSHEGMNLELDANIRETGGYRQAYVYALAAGPAQLAGIAESDELVAVDGVPADRMTDAQLKALAGECKIGETLRLTVRRLANDVIVPCGVMPYDDHNTNGSGGGIGGKRQSWEYSIKNLDAPDLIFRMEEFLASMHQVKDIAALIDLRGAYGTKTGVYEHIAAMFVQNGPIGCMYGEWRTDILCDDVMNGRVHNRWDDEFVSAPQPSFYGKVAVIIDDNTSGTALMLAAAIQHGGGVIITAGSPKRHWPDLYTTSVLKGDPAGRSIMFPIWHTSLTDQKDTDITADIVAAKGKEFDEAQQYLGLPLKPYDLREYD
jgi:hypothetical protein